MEYFFCQIWTFIETNGTSCHLAKLLINLVPEVGSNENGADLVHIGSTNLIGVDLPSTPISVDDDHSEHLSTEISWRRPAQVRLHPL